MKNKKHVFFCDCSSPDHLMVVELDDWSLDTDDTNKDILIFTRLSHFQSFWRRLVTAFRYVTKTDLNRIDYSEIVIHDVDEMIRLRDLIQEAIDSKEIK